MKAEKLNADIRFEMKDGHAQIELHGQESVLLFAVSAIACHICDRIGMETDTMFQVLPAMVQFYRDEMLKNAERIELLMPVPDTGKGGE